MKTQSDELKNNARMNLQDLLIKAGEAFYDIKESKGKIPSDLESHMITLGYATCLLSSLGERNFLEMQNTQERNGLVHKSLGPSYLSAAVEIATKYLVTGQLEENAYTLEQMARICYSAKFLLESQDSKINTRDLLQGPWRDNQKRGPRY